MKHALLLFALFLLSPVASNAQKYHLLPSPATAAGLRHAKEYWARASIKPQIHLENESGDMNVSPSFSTAFTPTNWMVLTASYAQINERYDYVPAIEVFIIPLPCNADEGGGYLNGANVEMGMGAYKTFAAHGQVEALLLYGNGNVARRRDPSVQYVAGGEYEGKYQSLSVQPSISYCTDYFKLSGGVRYGMRKYNSVRTEVLENKKLLDGAYGTLGTFADLEAGFPYLRFGAQLGISSQVNGRKGDESGLNFYGSFGISMRIAKAESRLATF
jgi:hypothetical protein